MKKNTGKVIFIVSSFTIQISISIVLLMSGLIFPFFIDYQDYVNGLERLINNEPLIDEDFVYLPSFFIFTPVLLFFPVYFVFFYTCLIVLSYELIKESETDKTVIYFMLFGVIFVSITGNIDPFIFLLLIFSLRLVKNGYNIIPAILLALIVFKPTTIYSIPLFLYYSKEKISFLIVYLLFCSVLNIYILFHLGIIAEFVVLTQTAHFFQLFINFPAWLWYIIYQYLFNTKLIWKEEI